MEINMKRGKVHSVGGRKVIMKRRDLLPNLVAAIVLIAFGSASIAMMIVSFLSMEIYGGPHTKEKLARVLGYPHLLPLVALMFPVGVAWLWIVLRKLERGRMKLSGMK